MQLQLQLQSLIVKSIIVTIKFLSKIVLFYEKLKISFIDAMCDD